MRLRRLWSGCSWFGGCNGSGHLSQFRLRNIIALFVDTDCDLHEFTSVLVPYVDAVFSRVIHSHGADGEAGELAALEGDLVAVGAHNFLLILKPGDLWTGVTPHCTS